MKRLVFLFVWCLCTLTTTAFAGVFERDWKTQGDGLLTYDDVNQREWLDLSVSRLDQFPEPRLENAIAEIAPGGIFDGFTWAKREDVRALAESAGIDTTSSDIILNEAPTSDLIRLLGATFESQYGLRSIALTDDIQTQYPSLPPYDGAAFLVNYGGFAGVFLYLNDDEMRVANGLMLYRPVPEPSGAMLLIAAAFVLLWRGGRRFVPIW